MVVWLLVVILAVAALATVGIVALVVSRNRRNVPQAGPVGWNPNPGMGPQQGQYPGMPPQGGGPYPNAAPPAQYPNAAPPGQYPQGPNPYGQQPPYQGQ
ncbi:hypothetical protein P8605_36920 [Streptomyces sp. T-3]|nr:hypothetical protein [Streptomyces sp. T-3]